MLSINKNINKKNSIIKNIFLLLKPYKIKIFASLILSIIITFLTILSPFLAQNLIDQGIMVLNFSVSIKFSLLIILIMIIEKSISLIQSILHIHLRNDLYKSLQLNMLRKIFLLKMDSFKENGFQSIFDSLNFDIDKIAEIADKNFLLISMDIFKMLGGLIALGSINYKLTLFILLIIPFKSLITTSLSKIKLKIFDYLVESYEDIGKWCEEIINGIREIKIWALYESKESEYSKLLSKKISLENKVQVLDEIDEYTGTILEEIMLNFIYILGVLLALNEQMTVGGIITFTIYSNIVSTPLSSLLSIKYKFANIKPSIDNYSDFIHKEEEAYNTDSISIDVPEKIIFKDVSLKFDNKIALKNISLEFIAGEKIAFIGTNGSGKSSLINLLLRFHTPSDGTILFNDLDINKINLKDFRSLFAVVSQDVYLFNKTIKENIDLFNFMNDNEIISFCESKGLSSFLNFSLKSNNGINSLVGMNGDKLSGGERQKILFLRALLNQDRQILILDEATASYDLESEQLFNETIINSDSYKFIFVVSHRPEILKYMDKIIVLNNGEIEAIGNYDELLKTGHMILE